MYHSLKQRAVVKMFSTIFRRTYPFATGFEMKPFRQSVFLSYGKKNLKFYLKSC